MKLLRVVILCYAERVQEMHDLAKYLPPPSMKGESFKASNLKVSDKEFSVHYIQIYIKNRLPSSNQDKLEDNQ